MRPNYILSEHYSRDIRKWVVRFFVGNCFEEDVDADLDKARLIAEQIVNEHASNVYRECKG